MITPYDDQYFMKLAIAEAKKAASIGEVPVGAVITSAGKVIARAHNQVELLGDVTAHAEILAITAASQTIGWKYLHDCKLYVTLEPCIMCAGALYWSQLEEVIFAAEDEKRGFMRYGKELLHPKTTVKFGLLAEESKELIQDFFKELRT